MKEITKEQALYKAAAYCSKGEKCLSEVTEKLRQWGVPDEFWDEITNRLISEKYVDEKRYAECYTKDKFRFNKWGKTKIALMLRSKGIETEYITNAIDTISDEEYTATLEQLLADKKRSLKITDNRILRAKLINHALSKGFEYNAAYHVIDNIMTEISDSHKTR